MGQKGRKRETGNRRVNFIYFCNKEIKNYCTYDERNQFIKGNKWERVGRVQGLPLSLQARFFVFLTCKIKKIQYK